MDQNNRDLCLPHTCPAFISHPLLRWAWEREAFPPLCCIQQMQNLLLCTCVSLVFPVDFTSFCERLHFTLNEPVSLFSLLFLLYLCSAPTLSRQLVDISCNNP